MDPNPMMNVTLGNPNSLASSMNTTVMAPGMPGLKPQSLADTVKNIQSRIAILGPGPHTPKQKEDLNKLNQLLLKAQQNPHAIVSTLPTMLPQPQQAMGGASAAMRVGAHAVPGYSLENKVLDKRRLSELVKEVDPLEQLDDDVEEMLVQIADDFIDNVVTAACLLSKHRKSNSLEVKDVKLHLERNWNMWIPGFGVDDVRPYKKPTTEAHKQRMALIKKTLKKY